MRLTLALAGVALAVALWTLPLGDRIGGFEAHMLRHAALVAVVPALIAPALPKRAAPPVALAAGAEFAAAWGWHLPGAHMAALLSPLWGVLEQASFLLAGIAVWWGAAAARPLAGTGALLLTLIHMTMLGAAIILAPRVLYPYCDLDAQARGGILMLAIVTPCYLIGGLALARRALDGRGRGMKRPRILRRPERLKRHPHAEATVGLAILAALAGGATVAFGLYDVAADRDHLPPTRWALHTTYRQAVRLRAPSQDAVPADLMDAARIGLGARHFDAACRQCHGAPGEMQTATVRRMRPEPPHVTRAVAGWDARHLFWILDHGVKMSGMPAWPAIRDDEVWSTVAFLEAARDMDAAAYAALNATPAIPRGATAYPETLAYCAGCHGTDGVGALGPFVPRLDIQGPDYIATSLDAYRSGTRDSGYMGHAASEPSADALAAMADYFGSLPVAAPGPVTDPDLAARGGALAAAGTSDDPACTYCHGPSRDAGPAYPSLAGQHERYLAAQLTLWRDGARGGGTRAALMAAAAEDLSDDEIAALAAYYAGLPPARTQ